MRSCLTWFALFVAAIAVVVIWPYRFEQPRLTVARNATGCATSVDVLSGWPPPPPMPFTLHRMNDPVALRLNLFSCPGAPEGTPAAVALTHEGKPYRGEACGREAADASLSCHIALPAVPGRYRLAVQLKEGEAPRAIDIDVAREAVWRPLWWDSAVGV
jgi:hypothetical protein